MKLIEFIKMERKWIIPAMVFLSLLIGSLSLYVLINTMPAESEEWHDDRNASNNAFLEIHNSKVERLQELLEDAEVRIAALTNAPRLAIIIPVENTSKIKLLQDEIDSANAEIAQLKTSVPVAKDNPSQSKDNQKTIEVNPITAPSVASEVVYISNTTIKNPPKQNILHRIMRTGEPYSVAYRNAQIGR